MNRIFIIFAQEWDKIIHNELLIYATLLIHALKWPDFFPSFPGKTRLNLSDYSLIAVLNLVTLRTQLKKMRQNQIFILYSFHFLITEWKRSLKKQPLQWDNLSPNSVWSRTPPMKMMMTKKHLSTLAITPKLSRNPLMIWTKHPTFNASPLLEMTPPV